MPGFDNNVVYANNVDFTGNATVTPQMVSDGQLLIGSTAAPNIKVGTLTAGTGISFVNASGSITINAVGGGLTWNVISVDQTMAINNGYGANKAGLLNIALPATAVIGSVVSIIGMQGSWKVTQAAGQEIFFGNSYCTSGATGYLASTNSGDCVELICIRANTLWYVKSSIGNIIVH